MPLFIAAVTGRVSSNCRINFIIAPPCRAPISLPCSFSSLLIDQSTMLG